MKVAVLCETLPPANLGSGLVLYRLLQKRDPREYCLISDYCWAENDELKRQPGQLPGKYYQVASNFVFNRGASIGLPRLLKHFNIPRSIIYRAREVTDILRRESCDAIVGCTGDLLDLPAAFLAARRVGARFYAYIFDHYSEREWKHPSNRFWARRFEPVVLRGATGVIVPNEVLGHDLRRRYGVISNVIHNSFDLSAYRKLPESLIPPEGEIRIVYTGDVYEAHYDAFHTLLEAIRRLHRSDVRLHLYTRRSSEELASQGIHGPVVVHPEREPGEVPRIQREARLLFLPLAFQSPYPNLVRTSATTKLGEYLGARRPVIVHAPPDSFIAQYFRRHECGLVVDRCDPSLMAQAIERVLFDPNLERQLAACAWEQAQRDFDIERARALFWDLISDSDGRPDGSKPRSSADREDDWFLSRPVTSPDP